MKLSILGSTGSIGTQALEVVEELKGIRDITVTGISGNRNLTLLEEQIRRFRPPYAAVPDEGLAKQLALSVADTGCRVLSGQEGLCYLAAETGADMVLSAIVGFAGLVPTLRAVEAGKDIALANKETLVTAGKIFMDAVKRRGVRLLPVDSEHCAIFQSLLAGRPKGDPQALADCLRRSVLRQKAGGAQNREKGTGAETSQLEHGRQDHH